MNKFLNLRSPINNFFTSPNHRQKILKTGLNILVILGLLVLPYYIFQGKLFINGDETNLFYVYPIEWIKQIAFFSWLKLTTLGMNNPTQFSLPSLLIIALFGSIVKNKVVVDYLFFSLPLILGFIYCKKLINEIFEQDKDSVEGMAGGLMYILSPILAIAQLQNFLRSVWLIPLLPIIIFYFIRYIKTDQFKYVIISSIWLTVLSISLIGIPWLLGFMLPFLIALALGSLLFNFKEIFTFLKKTLSFFLILILSQSFWLLPFSMQFLPESQSLGNVILSNDTKETFKPTVIHTSTGNIVYPLLNLFHRKIAVDFNWPVKKIFLSFYDNVVLLNFVFIFVLFFAFLFFKKELNNQERKIYIIFVLGFVFSLFFFTVNIGRLKYLFLSMGSIPGFFMFRNAFDKFALAYIFLYSIVIGLSLIIIRRRLSKRDLYNRLIIGFIFLAIIINALPIKRIVYKQFWNAENIYAPITIPDEYSKFMSQLKSFPSTTNILSLPFNQGSYTFIKDTNSKNIFAGTSPVYLFSGINDLSGTLSFPQDQTVKFNKFINDRNYTGINNLLQKFNINYVFVTRNIPTEVLKSYLFDPIILKHQDDELLKSITKERVLVSSKKNYELFKAKNTNLILNSNNLSFQKINPIKYRLYIKNVRKPQYLFFMDPYSNGWKLYLEKNEKINQFKGFAKKTNVKNISPSLFKDVIEDSKISVPSTLNYRFGSLSSADNIFSKKFINSYEKIKEIESKIATSTVNQYKDRYSLFSIKELAYLFKSPIFDEQHIIVDEYANGWIVDAESIKRTFPKNSYTENSDGSIDIQLTLYFKPQTYFYLGVIISILTVLGCVGYLGYNWHKSRQKNR